MVKQDVGVQILALAGLRPDAIGIIGLAEHFQSRPRADDLDRIPDAVLWHFSFFSLAPGAEEVGKR
ncbi:hypothetical protein LZP73_13925 [Shewanella sp. AS16]|uniref:hypothetical protein n=1 Tax=Shewanella sp. AS16 TaxID=2907625 RepID=UPI001F258FF5|nr:hypothetical protein [Shewanella sp. AS16]MCE9687291.1 hypothetical protein [Shewanella sp. AS16]